MVDRIEQKPAVDYRVNETNPDRHSRGNREDQNSDEQSFFEDKTDWRLLYGKTPHTTHTKKLAMIDINHLLFQSVSLRNDPSVLEAVVVFNNQTQEGPVFISIPRALAFKLQYHHRGESLPTAEICSTPYLQVIVPAVIELPDGSAEEPPEAPTTTPPLLPSEAMAKPTTASFLALVKNQVSKIGQIQWSWDLTLLLASVILMGIIFLLFIYFITLR